MLTSTERRNKKRFENQAHTISQRPKEEILDIIIDIKN